jgi:hypothetical protein
MELGYSIHYTTPSSASYVKTFNNTSIYLEIIKDQYNEEKFYGKLSTIFKNTVLSTGRFSFPHPRFSMYENEVKNIIEAVGII